jgi:hypothetical protein
LTPGHPLLGGAKTAGFLGIAQNLGLGDETVGAIAARAAAGAAEEGSVGQWGLFDAINTEDLVERLFSEAETWLFENTPQIGALSGPASMEPLTPPGMLVDGFDAWPAALLPYNPPYYPEFVEWQGYEPSRSWSAWQLDTWTGSQAVDRSLPAGRETWSEVLAAWRAGDENNDAAPGLGAWLAHLAGRSGFPAHPHLRWALALAFRLAVIVVADEGVCFGVPDFAPALRLTGGRLLPIGYALYPLALRRARRLRVFPAVALADWSAGRLGELYADLACAAAGRGYRELVLAPIFDGDEKSAEALAGLGARVTQRFTIYERSL